MNFLKTPFLAVSLLLAGRQLAHAQAKLPSPAPTTFTKEEQELLTLSKTKWAWMADKNSDALAGLFKENCVFVHMGAAGAKTRSSASLKAA